MRTTPDPHLAELLHRVTAEGWGNDSVGDLDQDGLHASLLIVEPAEQQELSEAFDRAIPAGNWIVTEDQHGFVVPAACRAPAAPGHPDARAPTGLLPQPRGSTGHAHPHR